MIKAQPNPDFLLGLASWSSSRLVASERDYFRLAIEGRRRFGARHQAANVAVHAQCFASSLMRDVESLYALGLGRHAALILQSTLERINAARDEIASVEIEAGRRVPAIPFACELNAPWPRKVA